MADDARRAHGPEGLADRVIWTVGGLSGIVAWLALLPSFALSWMIYGGRLFPHVAWWLLIPYLLWDLSSLYITVTRALRGRGPSTVPLVSMGYYALFSVFGLRAEWEWRLVAFGVLALFHAACYLLVPTAVERRVSR